MVLQSKYFEIMLVSVQDTWYTTLLIFLDAVTVS